jgi:glutathionyl-hydroquinone reductase
MNIARPVEDLRHFIEMQEIIAHRRPMRSDIPENVRAARKQYALLISPPLSWRNRGRIFNELKRLDAVIDEVAGPVIELDDNTIRFVVHVEKQASIIYQLASLGFTAPTAGTLAPGFDVFGEGIDLDVGTIKAIDRSDYMAIFEKREFAFNITPGFVVDGKEYHIDVAYEYNDNVKMVDTCIAFFERSWKLYEEYKRNAG